MPHIDYSTAAGLEFFGLYEAAFLEQAFDELKKETVSNKVLCKIIWGCRRSSYWGDTKAEAEQLQLVAFNKLMLKCPTEQDMKNILGPEEHLINKLCERPWCSPCEETELLPLCAEIKERATKKLYELRPTKKTKIFNARIMTACVGDEEWRIANLLRQRREKQLHRIRRMKYPVSVDYKRGLEDLVADGKYRSLPLIIQKDFQPAIKAKYETEVVVEIYSPSHYPLSTEKVRSAMKQDGYRPLNVYEFLTFDQKFPCVQTMFRIICLGDGIYGDPAYYAGPCYLGIGHFSYQNRNIDMWTMDNRWRKDSLFAVAHL